jgi:hypothetical protein
MKRLVAAILLVGALGGGAWAAWQRGSGSPELDEAAVNRVVDARLHRVLVGMLDARHAQR